MATNAHAPGAYGLCVECGNEFPCDIAFDSLSSALAEIRRLCDRSQAAGFERLYVDQIRALLPSDPTESEKP